MYDGNGENSKWVSKDVQACDPKVSLLANTIFFFCDLFAEMYFFK